MIEIERELKLSLPSGDLEDVLGLFSQRPEASPLRHKKICRDYYDTPDLRLHAAGLSLRVEEKDGTFYQTVKLLQGDSAGILTRKECMDDVAKKKPDLSAVSDVQAQEALTPFLDEVLIHIVTTQVRRRYFDMTLQGAVVEVAFDTGAFFIPAVGRSFPLSEIELELKSGDEAVLQVLGAEIKRLAPAVQAGMSKAARGIALYQQQSL